MFGFDDSSVNKWCKITYSWIGHTHTFTLPYMCVWERRIWEGKTNNTNEQTNERVEKHLICSQNWTAPATAPTTHISNETVNSWIVSFVINAVIWNVVINFNDELCVQVCDCVCVNIARTRSACFKLFRIEWNNWMNTMGLLFWWWIVHNG